MNFKKLSLALVLAAGLTACGAPTVDTSSEEAFKASISKIESKLSEKEAEEFGAAIGMVTMSVAMEAVMSGKSPEEELKKKLHGKTASEVIALTKK